MVRVFLGGGGSEHDESALWDQVFRAGQTVSVMPFAMPRGPARARSVQWFRQALANRGKFTVDPWGVEESGEDFTGARLHRSDVIAIPGGNTFDLLRELQRHHLLAPLEAFIAAGGPVYGGSAGAVLLGRDIDIARLHDPDRTGILDTRGLDQLRGALAWPHYEPAHQDQLRQWACQHQQVVLAMPEASGLTITTTAAGHTEARNVGPDPVHVFTPTDQHTHTAGASWSLPPC